MFLETYPDIDYVWLWLNEHSFMGVNIEKALENASFAEAYNVGQGYFLKRQLIVQPVLSEFGHLNI